VCNGVLEICLIKRDHCVKYGRSKPNSPEAAPLNQSAHLKRGHMKLEGPISQSYTRAAAHHVGQGILRVGQYDT